MSLTPKKYSYWMNTQQIRDSSPVKRQSNHNQSGKTHHQEHQQEQYPRQYRFNQNIKVSALKTLPNAQSSPRQSSQQKKSQYYDQKPSLLIERNRNNLALEREVERKTYEKGQNTKIIRGIDNMNGKQLRRKEQQKFQKQYVKIKSWYKDKQDKSLSRSPFNPYSKQTENVSPAKAFHQPSPNKVYNNGLRQHEGDRILAHNQKSPHKLTYNQYRNNEPYLIESRRQYKIPLHSQNPYFLQSKINPEAKVDRKQANIPKKSHESVERGVKRDNSPYRLKDNSTVSSKIFVYQQKNSILGPQSYRYNILSYGNDKADRGSHLGLPLQKENLRRYYK